MKARFAIACVFGFFSVSCHSLKLGKKEATEANPYETTDNGGYAQGGFYGDPAPALGTGAYPREGQTFGAYDATASHLGQGGAPFGHGGGGGSEQAQVVPFTEEAPIRSAPAPSAPHPTVAAAPAPKARSAKPAATRPAANRTTVAANKPRSSSSRTTAGTKSGSVMKAVYRPTGKSKTAAPARKMASLKRVHTIKPGDTLTKVSSRYGVSIATLKKRNGLASDTIVVGRTLTID